MERGAAWLGVSSAPPSYGPPGEAPRSAKRPRLGGELA
jgi:hypothetical protein